MFFSEPTIIKILCGLVSVMAILYFLIFIEIKKGGKKELDK
jgi:hypothetical protein